MSQFGHYEEAGYGEEPAGEVKTSGLAVTALICSLVFCCPVTTLLGLLLGFAAMFSIGSNPLKRGKGIAITAVLLGLVFTCVQGLVGWWYGNSVVVPMLKGPDTLLRAGFSGDTAGMLAAMDVPSDVTEGDAGAFIEELRSRYGEYESVSFDDQQTQPAMTATVAPFGYTLRFSNVTVDAEVEMLIFDQVNFEFMQPLSIIVFDPDGDDLEFPPPGGD